MEAAITGGEERWSGRQEGCGERDSRCLLPSLFAESVLKTHKRHHKRGTPQRQYWHNKYTAVTGLSAIETATTENYIPQPQPQTHTQTAMELLGLVQLAMVMSCKCMRVCVPRTGRALEKWRLRERSGCSFHVRYLINMS